MKKDIRWVSGGETQESGIKNYGLQVHVGKFQLTTERKGSRV